MRIIFWLDYLEQQPIKQQSFEQLSQLPSLQVSLEKGFIRQQSLELGIGNGI
jgi:hypothetical protein